LSQTEDLPTEVSTDNRFERLSTDRSDCRLSFAAPVGLLLSCNHIYNQYVFIDNSDETLQKFEKTARNMHSLSRYSRQNAINKEWIDEYLNEAHSQGLQSVRAHFNVQAWKAIASANMASYIKYLYKTVRKFFGEAVVVTQEVEDIISPAIVKDSIINNSDCKILLDQRKFMNKFEQIQSLLGLTEKEKSQILSINQSNDPSRLYKEVWIGLGGTQSAVYATEVSTQEYLAYTTEESVYIKIFLTDFLFFQHLAVFGSHKLIEGIEAWNDVAFLFQFTDVERHGIRQSNLFRSCGRLVVLLPKRQEQCLDALSLLDVKDLILGEEGIE
jgi:hypothetical protein